MSKEAIETALRISLQYLNPVHNPDAPGGVEAQVEAEKGTIDDVMAVLTKEDQRVRTIYNVVKKTRAESGD